MARRASVAHPCTGRQATHTHLLRGTKRRVAAVHERRSNSVLSERASERIHPRTMRSHSEV